MRWEGPISFPKEEIHHLIEEIGISETIAKLLLHRNIHNFDEANAYFNPDIRLLHDPLLMKDMGVASKLILDTIKEEKPIMVYGDYDVDGTTSVTLLYTYLTSIGAKIITYIPDRYGEGYGVSIKGIDLAKEKGVSLIIAIDCGIRAVKQVEYAKSLDIDFIICDHHLPGEEIPNATAILNPKQNDCPYPYKELCACGVGFKLIQAIHTKRNGKLEDLYSYLDLVAIAIAADIVPITGENRILAAMGLTHLNEQEKRVGVQSILESCNANNQILHITDLVFKIAPRINAAGRMKHAHHAVDLLIENNSDIAKKIASEIECYNRDRREQDKSITQKALQQIKENKEINKHTTVVYGENWHNGVLGIVASRLIETYYRPTIVFSKGDSLLTASARSVEGFNIFEALNKCSHLLEKFGGHQAAAGLSLLPENYQTFKEYFEKVVKETISEESLEPVINIEAEINLRDLIPETGRKFSKLYRIINRMRPFGPENNNPIFVTRNVMDAGSKAVGVDGKHLRLSIVDHTTKIPITGIGFGLGHKLNQIDKMNFEVVYTLEENHWNGKTSLQLMVKDVR